jgi:hypothetical protein
MPVEDGLGRVAAAPAGSGGVEPDAVRDDLRGYVVDHLADPDREG